MRGFEQTVSAMIKHTKQICEEMNIKRNKTEFDTQQTYGRSDRSNSDSDVHWRNANMSETHFKYANKWKIFIVCERNKSSNESARMCACDHAWMPYEAASDRSERQSAVLFIALLLRFNPIRLDVLRVRSHSRRHCGTHSERARIQCRPSKNYIL